MIAIALWLLSACLPAGTERVHLEHGGRDRAYYLQVPAGSAAAPVVFVLHGGGGGGERKGRRMGRFTGWDALAGAEGLVAVYPNAVDGNWNDGREAVAADRDDVGFLDAVLADVTSRASIDPARVYVTGISNGGFMAQRLLCERADVWAAGYSVVATMPGELHETCAPGRPVTVGFAVGTADPLVLFDGGPVAGDRGEASSAEEAVGSWVTRNGCDPAEPSPLPDLDPSDGSTVVATDWACAAGTRVRYLRIDGGGHAWPGGAQYLPVSVIGPVNRDVDAAADAWALFRDARLP